ncbi:MAG: sel1 repeat family protein [Verrucomicrobia subdivision 3 bacterium]|nr:sel1 repeat family protein [Limisphaerales bacterium]
MRFAFIFGLWGFLSVSIFSQDAPIPNEAPTRGAGLPDKLKAIAPQLAEQFAAELTKAKAGDALAQYELSRLLEWGQGAPVDLPQSFEWANKSATTGHALGLFRVGMMYRFGIGVKPDETKSNALLKRAAPGLPALAQAGHPSAARALGLLHYRGWGGLEMDKTAALKIFEQAAKAGDPFSISEMADQYWDGLGARRDRDRARKLYREALPKLMTLGEQGSVAAMYLAGNIWASQRHGRRDYLEAIRWQRPCAEQGYSGAQFMIGARYSKGHGVEQNDVLAMEWYRKAAAQGNSGAINNIGWMIGYGRAGEGAANPDKAIEHYRRAAERGNAVSQNNVGLRLKNAGDTEEEKAANLKERFQWHRRAAENDNARGQFELGEMYDTGQGTEPNLALAVKWYQRAAENDSAEAQLALSKIFEEGRGVPQNFQLALHWLARLTEFNRDKDNQSFARDHQTAKGALGLHAKLSARLNDGWPARLGELGEGVAPAEDAPPAEQFLHAARLAFGFGMERNEAEALRLVRLSADRGLADAQHMLAIRYEQGRDKELNDKKSFEFYKQAADQGHAAAANQLGVKLLLGESTARDALAARNYFTRAAEGGYADGMFNLAVQLAPNDEAAAVKWYQRAAQLGQPQALNEMGVRLLTGQGVPKDVEAAARSFRQAAWQGHAEAQHNFAGLCHTGRGVDANEVEAFVWWCQAALSGHEAAARQLEALASKLIPAQRQAAIAKANAWLPQLHVQRGEIKIHSGGKK